jgi:hypothetical protein
MFLIINFDIFNERNSSPAGEREYVESWREKKKKQKKRRKMCIKFSLISVDVGHSVDNPELGRSV